jgi:NADPH:quinone reductase-like Zn-dependent oxidoreductase
MRAITFSAFGGPEVLEVSEVPVPEPGPGQIRVAVKAVGINPVDWKIRRGMMSQDLPQRTGREVAGVVDALGKGVSDVAVGDKVFGFAVGGGAAEYTLSAEYAPMPASLDFVGAAGLALVVETATRILDAVNVGAATTVVVNGAAGGVGQSAVQIAHYRGARVIGTASERNQEFLATLGAEPVVYGPGLADRILALAPDGVDAAVDAGGRGALPDLIKVTGGPENVVTIADYAGAEELGVRFSGGGPGQRAVHALAEIGPLVDAGTFRLPVEATFPLEEIGAAHALSEAGHARGKIVLTV